MVILHSELLGWSTPQFSRTAAHWRCCLGSSKSLAGRSTTVIPFWTAFAYSSFNSFTWLRLSKTCDLRIKVYGTAWYQIKQLRCCAGKTSRGRNTSSPGVHALMLHTFLVNAFNMTYGFDDIYRVFVCSKPGTNSYIDARVCELQACKSDYTACGHHEEIVQGHGGHAEGDCSH